MARALARVRRAGLMLLSDELEAFRASVRAQATARIGPWADQLDRTQRFSPEVWHELRALDLFALPFPAAVGGSDGSFLAFAIATEEIASVSASAALYPGTTVQIATTLLGHGTPEQIERWVPALLAGEFPAAWAFTEPGTGSDPKQLTTRAEPDGDGWRLHGQKLFISFAGHAGVALVFARTPDGDVGAFLVDPASTGWSVGRAPELMAMGGGEPVPVFLDGVAVERGDTVGTVGDGFSVLLAGETTGKIRAAAICVGIAQRAIDEAAAWGLQRTHRGEPIVRKFATIQGLLGDMVASTHAARALVHHAAETVDAGRDASELAAAARIVAGRAAREVTSWAMQIGGAYGLTRDLPLERLYREGKFFEVAQGVVELQRTIVARHTIGRSGRPL